MFLFKKSIRIKTNAFDLTIETCLNQRHDEMWHSVIYMSKKLSSTKQNYDIHHKKLLTIIIILEI